jgi:hypothetical protein
VAVDRHALGVAKATLTERYSHTMIAEVRGHRR